MFQINRVFIFGLVSIALSLVGMNAQASSCAAQEVYWPVGTKDKCVADSVFMGAGQTRVLSSRGTSIAQPDGSVSIGNRGQVTVLCGQDGKLTIQSQNCTSGVDALASLRAQLPESRRIRGGDLTQKSTETNERAGEINNLEKLSSFEKSSTRLLAEAFDALQSKTQNYGVLGQGTVGTILQAEAPFSAARLRLEISTKFGHANDNGVLTTYIDHRICTPRQCSTVRNFLERGKYGGSGHYWGYEMTSMKTEEFPLNIVNGEQVTVEVIGEYLARDNNVRLYFIQ